MECSEFLKNNDVESGTLYRFIKGHKLTREVFYAGLIVFFVPSVFCDPDWSRLSFDKIYNDTNYAQLYHRPRPYNVHQYSTSTITHRPRTINYSPATIVHSSSNIVHSSSNTHYSPTSITHSSSDIVHRPSTIGYNPSTIGYNPSSKSHSSSNIIHTPRSIGHSSSNIVHSPSTIHNSPSSITHSSSNIDHSTSTIVHSSSNIAHSQSTTDFSPKYEDFRGNELEYEEYDYKVRDDVPLLVGISHDPFRYSVPEDDYLKGVRNMNPKSIMSMGENRGKRGVLHLYNMMYCATGCDPLAYKGYGCYCGFLGSGRPTDGIDRCCKMHDECYENIYCPFYTVYFQPYYWKCYHGQPLCALENAHTRHQFINGCAARLCECDRRFAMCVKRYSCPRRRALCRSSPIRLLQNILMFR